MKVVQSRSFENRVKRFSGAQKSILDEQIKLIIANPDVGTQKKGDLKEILVYKFKLASVLYLLAYRFTAERLELLMIGPHENYYRELKKYLKK
jgi:mRNA-degrading endonuclease RelE of RelBE toxin-antitoxin system